MLLTAAACSQFSVRERHDPAADFTRLHTWAWHPRTQEPWDRRLTRDRLDVIIQDGIQSELTAKGYAKVDDDPDFRVNFHVAVGARQALQSDPNTYGYYLGAWGMEVYAYDEGSLFVDVIDARTNTLMWRGVVSAVARPGLSLDERQARFKTGVEKVMAQFPPR